MAMKRCENGHFYDNTKHSVCPFCGVQNLDLSKTMPVRNPVSPAGATQGAQQVKSAPEKTVAKAQANPADGKTVGVMRRNVGFDPVVGWLVCVEGPDIGKDYRIRAEKNFIGRSASMDISIQGDESISRNNHAIISYNLKNNKFMLYPGDGHGLVYLNDDEVTMPTELTAGSRIEIGKSQLIFIPFCGEWFKWQKD